MSRRVRCGLVNDHVAYSKSARPREATDRFGRILRCGYEARSATDQGRPCKKNWRTSIAQGLVLRKLSMAASSDV